MSTLTRSGFLSRAWLLTLLSLLSVGVLIFALWDLSRPKGGRDHKELVLLCAAGLHAPVEQVRSEYKANFNVEIQIEPDGSGALLNKLDRISDYGDLFLAAESSFMETARQKGFVAEVLPIGTQRPVLAVAPGNPKKIQHFTDLLRDDVRVAIPNPQTTAVGKSVKRAVSANLWAKLDARLAQSNAKVSLVGTVREAAEKVKPKVAAVDVAIVWDATAKQYDLEIVEAEELRNIEDPILLGVLKRSKQPRRALHFARYLTARDKGQQVLQTHHYRPLSDADLWADVPKLHIMMGSMLQPAMEPILKDFEDREGVEIARQPNGCGILTTEMKAGKLPSAYFSCDVKFMEEVQEWFEPSIKLAENDLVLLVKKGNPKNIATVEDLTRDELHIGLGHPKLSALGEVTKRSLGLELYDKLYAKKIEPIESPTGHDLIHQIRFGPLDAAIVYRSNALVEPKILEDLDLIEVQKKNAFATQPFAIAKTSEHKYLLRRLQETLHRAESRKRFESIGFRWIGPKEER